MVDIKAYPAVRDWLLPFKPELEKRATKQEWFELQQAQLSYQAKFATPKIVFRDIANETPFAIDHEAYFIDCTLFMAPNADEFLLAFLNSKMAWFQWVGETPIASGGYIRLKQQYLSPTRLPDASATERARLASLGARCTKAGSTRFALQHAVRRRILDLAPAERRKLPRKLEDWWELDFAGFLAEVKRAFKIDVPLRQRGEWEGYLAENRATVRRLTAEIEAAEREIDAIVYRLFDLTPDEIALLEASLEGQY